jgi:hypothetical protein
MIGKHTCKNTEKIKATIKYIVKNKILSPKKPYRESLRFLHTDTAGFPGTLRIFS